MIYTLSVGRVILIVVLVIVIIVAIVLFVPVFYKLDADLDDMRFSVRATWILKLIRFKFLMDEDMNLIMGILFFHMDFLSERSKRRRKTRKIRKAEKEEKEEIEEERGIVRRVFSIVRTFAYVLSVMRGAQFMDEIWPIIFVFLFRVRPRDVHGRISFGMKDPSRTGEITGAVSAIPLIYQTDLEVVPDFEAEVNYIKGDVHAYGHILMLHLVFLVIGLIRKHEFRAFVGALRNR